MSQAHKELRAINRSKVLNLIYTLSPIPRVRIHRLTGLCKPTVSSIVNELIDEGLVRESNPVQTSMGRKPVNLRINENYWTYGVIDVRLWKTELAVCDLSGRILASGHMPTVPGNPVDFLGKCARNLARMMKSDSHRVLGASIILPCGLDSVRGQVHYHRTLDWRNLDVRKSVSTELNCPLLVENDARAAALAELMFAPETRDLQSFVYVLVTDGIGMGIVIERQLYYGAHFLDDRIGMKVINIDGRREELTKDSWDKNGSLRGAVHRFCDLNGIPFPHDIHRDFSRILSLARRGEQTSLRALKQAARYMGVGLANIYRTIDPERIIVGGEITRVWDLVADEIVKELESQAFFHSAPMRDLIVPGSLGLSTFDGARAMVFRDLLGCRPLPTARQGSLTATAR